MRNIVYIAASLDGYIATSDGGLAWLENIPDHEKNDFGYNDFIKSVDCIVMGKNTFEKVLSFGDWPYDKKVFVLSHSLKSAPDYLSDKVEIVNGNIPDIVSNLNLNGYSNLYIDGGKTIQSFLKLNLIDEMIITNVSLLLGQGIPLFGFLDAPLNFEVVKTVKLNGNLVQTHYKRKRE